MRRLLGQSWAYAAALALAAAAYLAAPTATLAQYVIAPAELEAQRSPLDARPNMGPRSLLPIPLGAWTQHTFYFDDRAIPEALIVSPADVNVFSNGVALATTPRGAARLRSQPSLQSGGPYLINEDFLHQGSNRIDVIFGRTILADLPPFLAAGPAPALAARHGVLRERADQIRTVLAVLALSGALLCIGVALVRRDRRGAAADGLASLAIALAVAPSQAFAAIAQPEAFESAQPAFLLAAATFAAAQLAAPRRRFDFLGVVGAGAAALCVAIWLVVAPGYAPVLAAMVTLAALVALGAWLLFRTRSGSDLGQVAAALIVALSVTLLIATAMGGVDKGIVLLSGYALALAGLMAASSFWAIGGARVLAREALVRVSTLAKQGQIIEDQRHRIEQQATSLEAAIRQRAILEERERFSREIHDGLGGNLLALLMQTATSTRLR